MLSHWRRAGSETKFSRFYFYDEENTVAWNLVQNVNEVVQESNKLTQDLFSESLEQAVQELRSESTLRSIAKTSN